MKKFLSVIMVVFMVLGLASCGYEDKQNHANAMAHQLFSAFNGAFEDNPGVELAYKGFEGTFKDGNFLIHPDGYTGIDMSYYLGTSFEGYYRVYVDPQRRCVTAALWSEEVINPVFVNDQMVVSELIDYYEIMGTAIGSWPYYEG